MSLHTRDAGDPTLAANMATASSGSSSSNSGLYPYTPNQFLAVIFIIIYALLIPTYGYLCIILPRRKSTQTQPADKHRYTLPLLIASTVSTIGYIMRLISVQPQNRSNITLYAISSAATVVSPIFICATLYLLLVKLIKRCLPAKSLGVRVNTQHFLGMSPRFLGIVFISSDVFSFLAQGIGSIAAAGNISQGSQNSTGTSILLVGLAMQLGTFVWFLIIVAQFCMRMRNNNTGRVLKGEWHVIIGIWVASGFILTRSIFRTVEFGTGVHGYAFGHEWTLYAFDAVPVCLALAVLAFWHPVRWLDDVVVPEQVVEYSPVGVPSWKNPFHGEPESHEMLPR